jgi:Fe-S-cluster containining protein
MAGKMAKIDRSLYKNGIRFQCQGSGKCCKFRGSHNYVYVNAEERKSLARHLGMSTSAFTRQHCEKEDGFYQIKGKDEACSFLDGTRCTVYEARPGQCRTWPFWPEHMNKESWKRDVVTFCPGIGKGEIRSAEFIESQLEEEIRRDGTT